MDVVWIAFLWHKTRKKDCPGSLGRMITLCLDLLIVDVEDNDDDEHCG